MALKSVHYEIAKTINIP